MNFRILNSVLVLVLMTPACGNRGDESKPPLPPGAELIGQWRSNCVRGLNFALTSQTRLGITQRSELTVEGDYSFMEVSHISSSPCDQRDIEITSKGSVVMGILSPQGNRLISMGLKSFKVKPTSEFGAKVLNISEWCGAKDWVVNEERDVFRAIESEKCFPSRDFTLPYSLDGNTLYFGLSRRVSQATDEAPTQPPELNKTFYFTRN